MNQAQMEILEEYYRAVEKTGLTDEELRRYVRREFGVTLSKSYIPDLRTRLKNGKKMRASPHTADSAIDITEFLAEPLTDWKPPYCSLPESRNPLNHIIINH